MKVEDPLNMIHEILTHPERQQDESVQKWLAEKKNKKLYDQCRLYIEAGTRKDRRFSGDAHVAFKTFKQRVRSRHRRSILSRSAVAASIILLIGLFGTWRFGIFMPEEEEGQASIEDMASRPFSPGKTHALLLTESGKTIVLNGQEKEKIHIEEGVDITYDSLQRMRYTVSEEETIHYHVLKVPKGGEYKLALSDGTIVWLNSESELRYPTSFRDSTREVELKGEGYFSVTRDAEKPFIVSASGIKTKVYGTEFNIRSYFGEDLNVTLVKGSISVSDEKIGHEYMLSPGKNACFSGRRPTITRVDVRCFTAWKEGSFYYKNERLENIMNELQRWYNFETVYTREELKNLRFELWINRDSDMYTIMDLLTSTNKVQMKMAKQSIIISDI